MTNLVFENISIRESGDPIVDLSTYPFAGEPMYFKWKLSATPTLWTRKSIADKLLAAQKEHLEPLGRKFKIWDPWRSREVQNNIYQKYWNELAAKNPDWSEEKLQHEVGIFVTRPDNPKRIPPHATGGSIDLTVLDAKGNELDFGTVFDHFGPEAASDYFENNDSNSIARDNRRWLHTVMKQAGFETDVDEWWHFDYGNQKWAVQAKKDYAFYGEIVDPLQFNARFEKEIRHAL